MAGYVGINDIAKLIKSMYVGVNGTARKVIAGYVGVSGIARQFYKLNVAKTISYYGTITNLSENVSVKTWGTRGNYCLFVGGNCSSINVSSNKVEIYNNELTHSTGTDLNEKRRCVCYAETGNYGCFMGGITGTNANTPSKAYCYDTSLTRTVVNMSKPRYDSASASSKSLAMVFGSGVSNSYNEALDSSLTLIVGTTTSGTGNTGWHNDAGARAGDYAVFAGAQFNPTSAIAFDDNLTATNCTSMSSGRYYMMSATIQNKAVFMGGVIANNSYSTGLDIYNTDLTHSSGSITSPVYLQYTSNRNMPTIDKYTMCGNIYTSASNNYTEFIDEDMTCQIFNDGVQGGSFGMAGDYFIVCGGNTATTHTNTAYAYVVS